MHIDKTRECGTCSLCCKVLPVNTIDKPAHQWCRHAKPGHGCMIYADRPVACRVWHCLWLDSDIELERPDKSHFVVDAAADAVGTSDGDKLAIQVWEDPAYPGVWRYNDALRKLAIRAATNDAMMIIRHSTVRSTIWLAPPLGQWQELRVEANTSPEEMTTRLQQLIEKMGGSGWA